MSEIDGPQPRLSIDPRAGEVAARLARELEGRVPPGVLNECVADCFRERADARIQDFVPIFAERLARRRLADLTGEPVLGLVAS